MESVERSPWYEGEAHGWDPSEQPQQYAVNELHCPIKGSHDYDHNHSIVQLNTGEWLMESVIYPGKWFLLAVSNG